MVQAGVYGAMHALSQGDQGDRQTKDADKVDRRRCARLPINDFMTKNGKLREDGRVIRDMYLFEVKKPAESKGQWDLLQAARRPMPGDAGLPPARARAIARW